MVPLEELYEVLSKVRDLRTVDNSHVSCSFCHRDRSTYDWHDKDCPVRKLYEAVAEYDDAKVRMQNPTRWVT